MVTKLQLQSYLYKKNMFNNPFSAKMDVKIRENTKFALSCSIHELVNIVHVIYDIFKEFKLIRFMKFCIT